jgi:dihydroorotate dehydrogenase electron transfer subunit
MCVDSRLSAVSARIAAQKQVSDGVFELVFEDRSMANALPGQFVQVRCEATLLRRPLSLYQVEGGRVSLLYRVRGSGTEWLSHLKEGDVLDVLGPLGKPFEPPSEGERLLLVGGGIGIAPLACFAARYPVASAIAAFRSGSGAIGLAPFHEASIPLSIHTDDASLGEPRPLIEIIQEQIAGIDRVLACGPEGMMKEISEVARLHGVRCEVSLERKMACGTGLCLGCVVPLQNGYARACKDGPVFDAEEVLWM